MLVREFYRVRNDGKSLFKTYSDQGFYIKKQGEEFLYSSAVDLEGNEYIYIETEEKIEEMEENSLMT